METIGNPVDVESPAIDPDALAAEFGGLAIGHGSAEPALPAYAGWREAAAVLAGCGTDVCWQSYDADALRDAAYAVSWRLQLMYFLSALAAVDRGASEDCIVLYDQCRALIGVIELEATADASLAAVVFVLRYMRDRVRGRMLELSPGFAEYNVYWAPIPDADLSAWWGETAEVWGGCTAACDLILAMCDVGAAPGRHADPCGAIADLRARFMDLICSVSGREYDIAEFIHDSAGRHGADH